MRRAEIYFTFVVREVKITDLINFVEVRISRKNSDLRHDIEYPVYKRVFNIHRLNFAIACLKCLWSRL